jgi:hypothetical protein
MKRYTKMWITFSVILIGLVIVFGTMYYAYKHLTKEITIRTDIINTQTSTTTSAKNNLAIPSVNDEMVFTKDMAIPTIYKVILSVGSIILSLGVVYFFLSLFGKRSILGIHNNKIVYMLITIIVASIMSYGNIYLTSNYAVNKTNINVSNK